MKILKTILMMRLMCGRILNADGWLLGYVGEYNECFNTGKENVDWAEHIILFSYAALKRGYDLHLEIKEECRRAVKYLEKVKVSVSKLKFSFCEKKEFKIESIEVQKPPVSNGRWYFYTQN